MSTWSHSTCHPRGTVSGGPAGPVSAPRLRGWSRPGPPQVACSHAQPWVNRPPLHWALGTRAPSFLGAESSRGRLPPGPLLALFPPSAAGGACPRCGLREGGSSGPWGAPPRAPQWVRADAPRPPRVSRAVRRREARPSAPPPAPPRALSPGTSCLPPLGAEERKARWRPFQAWEQDPGRRRPRAPLGPTPGPLAGRGRGPGARRRRVAGGRGAGAAHPAPRPGRRPSRESPSHAPRARRRRGGGAAGCTHHSRPSPCPARGPKGGRGARRSHQRLSAPRPRRPRRVSPRSPVAARLSVSPVPGFVLVSVLSSVSTKGTERVGAPARGAAAGSRRSAARTHNYKPVSIKQFHGPRRGWSAAPQAGPVRVT